jgi:hypothetical protein
MLDSCAGNAHTIQANPLLTSKQAMCFCCCLKCKVCKGFEYNKVGTREKSNGTLICVCVCIEE